MSELQSFTSTVGPIVRGIGLPMNMPALIVMAYLEPEQTFWDVLTP
jgi:hypothetical protein